MIVIDTEQGTEQWFAERAGIPTASEFKKLVTSTGKPSKSLDDYVYKLAAERLSGTSDDDGFKSYYMSRGNELEQDARLLYEYLYHPVEQVGFCLADDRSCGCSPDGLVGEEGGVEIKCLSAHVHTKYLYNGGLPAEFVQQIQGSLFVTGRKWWDLMLYHPNIKPFVLRVFPDDKFHLSLKDSIALANKKIAEIVFKIGGQK